MVFSSYNIHWRIGSQCKSSRNVDVMWSYFRFHMMRRHLRSRQPGACKLPCRHRLMSWRAPQEEHEHVSETGVCPSLDRVSGTLCLLHYVTETSHLYSLRDFWKHFCLSRAAAHSDCCFSTTCTNILTYLLTYIKGIWPTKRCRPQL